ncbi:protein mono-ADP-ribosyltransferase TIPARP-like isoform X2 [Polyodon spathula]|uniref:protein mono-ADP-ribosyltransferase TIPARP-like isoform X2 n=1 Tax=Polyodon spathula TaxID=7913 RepID=UPI001B7E5C81|nr:protein mono-ADP-ribosyltransferase TIPARP-like isoform X2 [Polyodon spathula]
MDHPTSSERCRGVVCKRRLVRSEVADSSECNPAQKPPARKSRASAQEVKAQLCWQGHVHFHTYHKDGVLICDDFLAGHCHLGQECQRHHTPRPYHWQLRQTHTKDWVNVSEFGQKHLEALFCNPDKTEVTLSFENAGGQGDLVQRQHRNVYHKSQTKGEMVCEDTGSVSGFSKLDLNTLIPQNNCSYNKVRRLATTSNPDLNPHFLTKWNISWQELGKWELYKEPVISQLEAAFEKGMWNQAFMLNGNLYNVDLKKYTQRNLTTNFIREVRRRPQLISDTELWPLIKTLPLEESKDRLVVSGPDPLKPSKKGLPPTWVPRVPRKEVFAQIPVLKSGVAYACIHNLFHRSLSKSEAIILDIYQIQNMHLWTKYTIQKKFMSRGLPSAELSQLEMLLFHGTTKEAVPSICKNNFDPRVSGRQHGSTYGQGTYFAKNASCSARYAIESKSGSRYMFLAMVLVGKAAVGKQSFRRPPPLEPDSPTSDLYNSCVDKEQQPQMFVIFDSCQCYPYFLIHYKKLTDTVDVF